MTVPHRSGKLHLNAFLMTIGHHESAWRFPESSLTGTWDVAHYKHLARVAERGTFDSIFFGDCPALQGDIRYRPVGRLDPTALLPALAAATERIGLVATASTTYNEPLITRPADERRSTPQQHRRPCDLAHLAARAPRSAAERTARESGRRTPWYAFHAQQACSPTSTPVLADDSPAA